MIHQLTILWARDLFFPECLGGEEPVSWVRILNEGVCNAETEMTGYNARKARDRSNV